MFRKTVLASPTPPVISAASLTPAAAHGHHGLGFGGFGLALLVAIERGLDLRGRPELPGSTRWLNPPVTTTRSVNVWRRLVEA